MIIYSNIERFDSLPFAEYLQLPGLSHSFMRQEKNGITEDIVITENIRIGKLVDGILTDPAGVDYMDTLYPLARNIAHSISRAFRPLIKQFKSQVSFTAETSFNEFKIATKGRVDWLVPNHAVIDLKVTKSSNIASLVNYMGYKNQLWHYAKLAGVAKAFLMIYSIPLHRTELKKIDCSENMNSFFADKIMKFGKVEEVVMSNE